MQRSLGTMVAASSPNSSTNLSVPVDGGGGGSEYQHLRTNIIIILTVLFCGLTSVLLLYSIFRCALRYNWRLPFETMEEMTARLAAKGLKKDALRRIPVAIYGYSANIREIDCSICLVDFAGGEEVRMLPGCNHGFHVQCIDMWLSSHSSCPTCRYSLLNI